jgi:Fe-S-cluster containining protein
MTIPENNQFTDTDHVFFDDGHKLAQSSIEQGISNASLFTAISSLYQAIDELNFSLLELARRQNISVDCHRGCQWCCHQAVYANSFEIHYLSDYLKRTYGADELNKITILANTKNSTTQKLSENELLRYKEPCPLLRNGCCMAYEGRPMACRIYLSKSLATCYEFYQNPQNEYSYPQLLDFPLRAGRMMNEGFIAAFKQIGLNNSEFRLEEGLSIALASNQPDIGLLNC